MANLDALIFGELVDSSRIRVNDWNSWRYKVLMAIADAGADGATDNELADLLQAPGGQNNIRPRRGELVEYGFLRDSGSKRKTPSGSQATVWLLSSADRLTFTAAFTAPDCQLAGRVADASSGGQPLTQAEREEGEKIRARFALVGRRARRVAAGLGAPVEVDIDPKGPIALTVWHAESERARFQVTARLDDDGLHLVMQVGAANSGDAAADARRERFRSELANLPDAVVSPLADLTQKGWELTTASSVGETPSVSVKDWLKALVDDPSVSGSVSRSIGPSAVEKAGSAIADELGQFLTQVLPLDTAAESAMKDPVQALVNGLHWDENRARNLIALTGRARQLLFAGPPGTGKTLAARILAAAVADESRIKLVQFHPTYAYEDFVEGIRPVLDEQSVSTTESNDGLDTATVGLRYQIRDGVFKQIVRAASASPDAAHFLIIDEINRANLPRVLGELLFALEYRGEENPVELAYSGDGFYVPENLWVIGTMNTADRSVALLDAAMRRRFKEVRFDVDYDVIRRWHDRNTSPDLGTEAAARLERLNAEVIELLDEDRAIGHSFLIRPDLADVGFEVVWTEDLEPVLRDHLLGRTDDLPSLREGFLGDL